MPNRVVSVELRALVNGYVAGMKQASQATTEFAGKAKRDLEASRQHVESLSSKGLVAGGALVAGVGLVAKAYADFDRQVSAVAATGDDARSSLDGLRAAALKAGKDTAYSATEAAEGVENLLKAGVSASDVLSGGLIGSLNLAAAGEMSVADAAETAAMALTQFKLEGSDVAHVADLLAAGAGKAQGEVSDLAMGLKQSGLVASQFGISIEDTVGTLSAFANAGLIGSDAGTSFKSMLLQLAGPSGTSAKLMKELGISAYDAQGKFVGMTALAGQLQAQLGGLTQAQRNQAMAQIFGSDAMRAASVLYEQGAAGLQKVIDQTNDAGYAARTAATRMDNLAGDWEKFTGSLETASLQSGSGINAWLRGLTQSATDFADVLGEVPAPVLDLVVKLGALAGGGLLAVSMLGKLTTSVAGGIEEFVKLRAESPRLAAGLTKAGKAAAVAGVAFAALQVASVFGSSWQAEIDKGAGSLADMAAAAAASKSDLQGLDAQFAKVQGRFFFWQTGASQARDFGDALRQVSDNSKGFLGGLSGVNQFIAGLVGQKTAITELREQTEKLDQSLASIDPTVAQQAFSQIAKAADEQGMAVEDLIALFPDYKATLVDTATQLGVSEVSAKEYADWMGGKIPDAVSAATAAHPELVGKLNETQKAAAGGAESLEEYAKSVWAAADAVLETSGSQVGFERALDSTGAAVDKLVEKAKKAGKFKDLTNVDTELGRQGIEHLNKLTSATEAYTQKLISNGGTQDEVRLAVARARGEFIAEATAMGYSRKKAEQLADARNLIPKNIKLETTEEGSAAAQERLKDLKSAIKDLPKSAQTKVLSEFDKNGVDAAYTALAKIDKKKAEAWIKSMLDQGGIDDWKKFKPKDKTARINVDVNYNRLKSGLDYFGKKSADGGLFSREMAGLVQRFSDGGTLALADLARRVPPQFASGGFGQPQVRPYQGAAGVQWGEQGSGPWEAFISGAPQKRDRSIAIWKEVGRRLLGTFSAEDLIAQFADGGIAEPTHKGKPLSFWKEHLKTDLELTRMQIEIRDLKKDLAEKETYTTGKGKKRKKRKRDKLRGLDRTEAQQQLAETEEEYGYAVEAKKLNASKQGAIDARIEAWEAERDAADEASQASKRWQDQFMTGASAADLLANMQEGAARIAEFNDLLGKLDSQGLSDSMMSWLWDQGPGAAGIAGEILAGGKASIDAFNKSSGNLAKVADAAGQSQATGTWVKSPVIDRANLPGYMTSGANGAVVGNRTVTFHVTQSDPYAAAVYFDQQLRYL